jgi:hypothetical protein
MRMYYYYVSAFYLVDQSEKIRKKIRECRNDITKAICSHLRDGPSQGASHLRFVMVDARTRRRVTLQEKLGANSTKDDAAAAGRRVPSRLNCSTDIRFCCCCCPGRFVTKFPSLDCVYSNVNKVITQANNKNK